MQLITETYRGLNEDKHDESKSYGTTGVQFAPIIMQLCQQLNTEDVLDYGCGKSKLSANLPFRINQYDPCVEKYKSMPQPADIVVCTEVMEHIEPECLDDVVKHIASLAKKMIFMTVATTPAVKTLADGRNCHLIVEQPDWWFKKLWQYFRITNFETNKNGCIVYGIPNNATIEKKIEPKRNPYQVINLVKEEAKNAA